MRIRKVRYILAAVLLGAVGAYLLQPGDRPSPSSKDVAETTPDAVVNSPFVPFTDVTESAGIRFRHFNGATGKKLLPETMGSGVAVLDFDRDGKPDLLFVNSCAWPGCPKPEGGSRLCLYRNKGDGTFEDVTAAAGLALTIYGMGVAVGDIDNDGFPDVFITALGGNYLFHNVAGEDGKRRYRDITKQARVGGAAALPEGSAEDFFRSKQPIPWPTSATFVDYDGDGKLDLFVCYYVDWSPGLDLSLNTELPGLSRSYGPPRLFTGVNCVLYRNIEGTRFEDVSQKAGIQVFEQSSVKDVKSNEPGPGNPVGKALGVVVCDPDEDGWPDLAVANDTSRNFFFHNVPGPDGGRRFEEIGLLTNVGRNLGAMGIDWGEYGARKSALLIANYSREPYNFLTMDDPRRLFFTDAATKVGLAGPRTCRELKFGTFFFDYDLDGRLDILACNGQLEPDITKVMFFERYAQPPLLFWNTGQDPPRYESVTEARSGEALFRPLVGRGCAYLDFDGDGDLDVVLTENNGPARLLRNDNALENHWIRLELVGDGMRSSRDAIGAHVTIEANGAVQHRYVAGSRGYLSQSEHVITVGLCDSDKVDIITVRWPGKEARFQEWRGLAANRLYELRQGTSAAVPLK